MPRPEKDAAAAILAWPRSGCCACVGPPGKYVKFEDTVKSFRMIIDGNLDDLPEQAFSMKGGIEEVLEHAEKMKAQGGPDDS